MPQQTAEHEQQRNVEDQQTQVKFPRKKNSLVQELPVHRPLEHEHPPQVEGPGQISPGVREQEGQRQEDLRERAFHFKK